mgnify:CR=1 FL=1
MDRIFYNDIREIVATCQRFGCEPMKGYVLADAFAEVIRKIEELENKDKRITKLEEALQPFAVYSCMDDAPTLRDYEAARAALEGKE